MQDKSYCEICRLFCIWCCCGCCRTYKFHEFILVFETNPKGEHPLKDTMIKSSTLDDIPENAVLQISSAPDIEYLIKRETASMLAW